MPGLEMPGCGGGAAMLRELRDEERPTREDQAVLEENPSENTNDPSYDSMTKKLTNKQTEQKSSHKSDKSPRKQTNNLVGQLYNHSAGQSVADIIRRRTAQRQEQEVLKTVTLKLSPSLDEKIEQYCFDNKMKKQEFWAEAAALYFEMIAEGEGV